MPKSKSPKKEGPESVDTDPEMQERARKAQAQRSKKKEDFLDKYAYHIVFGLLIGVLVLVLVNNFFKGGPDVYTTQVNDASYIESINSNGLSFTVAANKLYDGFTLAEAKKTINVQASNKQQLYKCNTGNTAPILPDTFNFRE